MDPNGHGRHSAADRHRRVAPLVALLAVLALAAGGWAALARGGTTSGVGAVAAGTAPVRPGTPLAGLAPVGVAGPAATSTPAPAYAAEVVRLTNQERVEAGCPALRLEPKLQAAAQRHSQDMVDRHYFSHTSPDGEGPGDRAAAQGYTGWSGENIAAGIPTPVEVVQAWMSSAGHRANILNCRSAAIGVGYDARAAMWTQLFGYV